MTSFDTQFAAASSGLFEQFGEDVIYTPLGGSPRTIRALVDRGPLADPAEMQDSLAPHVAIECLDDAVLGIASGALNTGGDTVTVALWPGQTPVALPITRRSFGKAGEPVKDGGLISVQCGG